MNPQVLVGREHESMEAKTRWFSALTLEQRMRVIADTTDLLVAINPNLLKKEYAEPARPGVQVIKGA